jgi:hypothetical protein
MPRAILHAAPILGAAAAVVFSFGAAGVGSGATPAPASAKATATAAGLVRQALAAELAGDAAQRRALLAQAVQIDGEYAPARWHAGQVRAGAKWLTPAQVGDEAANNRALQQYQQLRAGLVAAEFVDADSHAALARWCTQQKLTGEAAYHWFRVLQSDPQNAEGLRMLDAQWHQGQLVRRTQLAKMQKDARRAQFATRSWRERLLKWAEQVAARDADAAAAENALREVRAIRDVDAIAALDALVEETSGELALAAVEALGEMVSAEATLALVRASVIAPDEAVRQAAGWQLQRRPAGDWAPHLLAGMEKPLESWHRIVITPQGHVTYRHELYREGPAADLVVDATQSFTQQDVPGASVFVRSIRYGDHFRRATPAEERQKAAAKTQQAGVAVRTYAASASRIEQQVQQANEQAALFNPRIRAVLSSIAGQDLGDDPQAWWDWWQQYNEVHASGEKPELKVHLTNHKSINLIPTVWMSCFVRGTKVHAQTGIRPIETIQAGDLVLAQDIDTGELAYKPVLLATVRPPCPLLRLTIGGEAITTTRGHPFWVTSNGWRMAKELQRGDRVHALDGSFAVESIESLSPELAYNLVVGDFSTYFVGERGVLVHDNTFRRPTISLLPGLARKTVD